MGPHRLPIFGALDRRHWTSFGSRNSRFFVSSFKKGESVTKDSPESYDQLRHSGSKGLALDRMDSVGPELSELLRDKDCELREKDRELHRELVEKGNIIAERQARIDRLTQILDNQRAELERTLEQARDFARQLAAARNRPMRVLWDLLRYRLFSMLSNSPPLPARTAARFAKSAEKRDPTRSVRNASEMRLVRNAPESMANEEPLRTQRKPLAMLDGGKKTVLIVSHEMSRTGAPILALNLIQRLSPRYNVISLALGRGDLADDFRNASALLYEADRIHMTDRELRSVVKDITAKHSLSFAIVNSVVDPRVFILRSTAFGTSRHRYSVDRNSVLNETNTRERRCGSLALLSMRLGPRGASGEMYRSG
jgi:hypothetical protein